MFEWFDFDWQVALGNALRLGLAFLLALPIAWDRTQSTRNLGLRTFPIVAVASCGYLLISLQLEGASAESIMRGVQGLLTGIGFVGGGAILKEGGNVRGLATAASIWNTGAIGAAVAFGREEIAILLSVINFLLLRLLTPIAEKEKENQAS